MQLLPYHSMLRLPRPRRLARQPTKAFVSSRAKTEKFCGNLFLKFTRQLCSSHQFIEFAHRGAVNFLTYSRKTMQIRNFTSSPVMFGRQRFAILKRAHRFLRGGLKEFLSVDCSVGASVTFSQLIIEFLPWCYSIKGFASTIPNKSCQMMRTVRR